MKKDYSVNGYFLCGMSSKGCVVGKDNPQWALINKCGLQVTSTRISRCIVLNISKIN